MVKEEAVQVVQEGEMDGDLLVRLKIFVRDLLTFSSDSSAQARLSAADPTPPAFYMSAPYFSCEEARRLLNAPPQRRKDEAATAADLKKQHGATLCHALQDMQRCKAEKGEVHLCTSHDLAPLIQGWFGIRKGFQEDPQFKKDLKLFLKKQKKQQGRLM